LSINRTDGLPYPAKHAAIVNEDEQQECRANYGQSKKQSLIWDVTHVMHNGLIQPHRIAGRNPYCEAQGAPRR
jgi:hypothetical protein